MSTLTRAQKRRVESAIRRARSPAPLSAQQTIPYEQMFRDGVCRVRDRYYTKTIGFEDISYQLLQDADRDAVFAQWCELLNYFDSSVCFELTFLALPAPPGWLPEIMVPAQKGDLKDVADWYRSYLSGLCAAGSGGLVRKKYLTFGTEAGSLREARQALERVETDLLSLMNRLGARAAVLDGTARLSVLHAVFHCGQNVPFEFSWEDLPKLGIGTRDLVAPDSFRFSSAKTFSCGSSVCAASFLQITASELSDRMLAELLDLDRPLLFSVHLRAVDRAAAIKTVKRKITDLQKMTIDEQKRAVRAGYDMDLIPSDLSTYGEGAKQLLGDLQTRNEHLFFMNAVAVSLEPNPRALESSVFRLSSVCRQHSCRLARLDWQQEEGLASALPLGDCRIRTDRAMTTTAAGALIPFTTRELFDPGPEALYCGINPVSRNIIMVDRKQQKNPNGLILGTPGSGKSFAAKREIVNTYLVTDDDIIICDPESEYGALTGRLHGQVIRVSPVSGDWINPMDLSLNYSEEDDPLTLKSDFLLSLCELILGGREGLSPVQKTVIDRCVRLVYRPYLQSPSPESMPVLEDLYRALLEQEEPEAKQIATALEIYVRGSLSVFNHRTNVDIRSRVVCYDIRDLGKQLKKIGMLIVQDQVWNRLTRNRSAHRSTRYYIDEMHLLLREEQTAAYTVEIWKRFRKWGGIPTGITQNVKDLLSSREVENIFENSDYVLMLNQAPGDRQILAQQLGISPQQLAYVTRSAEGEGLLVCGSVIIPFRDRFPRDTELYRIMTTRPGETGSGSSG